MKGQTVLAASLRIAPALALPSLLHRSPSPHIPGAYKQNDEICSVLATVDPVCFCQEDDILYCDITDDQELTITNSATGDPPSSCGLPADGELSCKSGSCWLDGDCGWDSETCACIGSTWTHKGTCNSRVSFYDDPFPGRRRDLAEDDDKEEDTLNGTTLARREVVMAVDDPLREALKVLGPEAIGAATTMVSTKLGGDRGKYLLGLSGRLTTKIVVAGTTWAVGQAWLIRHDFDPQKGYHVNLSVGSNNRQTYAFQQIGLAVAAGTTTFTRVAHVMSGAVGWMYSGSPTRQCFGGKFNQVTALATTIARWTHYMQTGSYTD